MISGLIRHAANRFRVALVIAIVFATHAAAAQTIRMWTFLNPNGGKTGREVVLRKLMDNFEAANPGVKIQVEPQDFRTLSTKFFAAHQTGTEPDVIWVLSAQLFDAIKLGSLANLDELFVRNWSKADVADVDGPFWRYGATATAHYQIMHSLSIAGEFYRVDLFKQTGIDPKTLSTWDKFIAAAQKLTARNADGTVTRWGFGQGLAGTLPITPVLFSMLMDRQGTIFDKNFRANWSTPAGVESLNLELDMSRTYGITPPNAVSTAEDDVNEQFYAGRLAILRGGSARFSTAAAALGAGNVGYLPTPSFTEGKHSPSLGTGWCIGVWSGGKQKELAGKWVEYMSSKAADALWSMEAGQIPIRQSTVTDHRDFFNDPSNAYFAEAAADLRDNGWFPPEGAGSGGWSEGLNAAAQDVMLNHIEPKAALEKAEAVFNRTYRR